MRMSFAVRRFAQMALVWVMVSVLSFFIVYFAPGDPLYVYMTPGATGHKMTDAEMERMRESLGLNGSALRQYSAWLGKALRGHLGISLQNRQPVLPQIASRLPRTAALMGTSLLLSLAVAVPLGLIAGTHRHGKADRLISALSYLGISTPSFWLGIMMIILFAMKLRLLPASGIRTIGVNTCGDAVRHAVLPVAVLSLNNIAVFVRYIRAGTIAQLEEEYVQTALSKGLSRRRVLFRHVLRNCLLPVVTIAGSRFGTLVTGSFIVETVFSWPGLGMLGMSAINNRDYPMIMGITMISCTLLLLGNFAADLLYRRLDPRIRFGEER